MGPSAVRYPRGAGTGVAIDKAVLTCRLARAKSAARQEIALLAFGSMLTPALAAAEELDATVANMRFVKPIDRDLIRGLAAEHSLLISVEENAVIGGAGSEVARVLEEIASPAACCDWEFLTTSSITATRRCCWRNRSGPRRHRPGRASKSGEHGGRGRSNGPRTA